MRFRVRWTPRFRIIWEWSSFRYFTFAVIAITILMFYDIDRSTHQRNIEPLETANSTPLITDNVDAELVDRSGVRAVS